MRREGRHRLRHLLQEVQRQHGLNLSQAVFHLLLHLTELVRRPGYAQGREESVQVLQPLDRLTRQREVVATTC